MTYNKYYIKRISRHYGLFMRKISATMERRHSNAIEEDPKSRCQALPQIDVQTFHYSPKTSPGIILTENIAENNSQADAIVCKTCKSLGISRFLDSDENQYFLQIPREELIMSVESWCEFRTLIWKARRVIRGLLSSYLSVVSIRDVARDTPLEVYSRSREDRGPGVAQIYQLPKYVQ